MALQCQPLLTVQFEERVNLRPLLVGVAQRSRRRVAGRLLGCDLQGRLVLGPQPRHGSGGRFVVEGGRLRHTVGVCAVGGGAAIHGQSDGRFWYRARESATQGELRLEAACI